MTSRRCLALDWDGTCHRHTGWHPGTCLGIDTSGISQAHALGYAVVIQTCGELPQIAAELRSRGYTAEIATARAPWHIQHWQGGPDGRVILVTGFKVRAVLYPDDRGARHRYGDDWAATLSQIASAQDGVTA